jgi:hypothetical protein
MIARARSRVLIRRLGRGALVPAAGLLVHQLRYELAFGGHARVVLARQGHAYLHSLIPWIVLLIGAALGAFLWALGRALGGQRSRAGYALSFVVLWLGCAACLIGIYVVQELLEGWFAAAHAPGLAGVFGYGGWWSVPAALCVGLVLAAIFHGARWVLDEVAQRHAHGVTVELRAASIVPRWRDVLLPRLSPLADGLSVRGPPR